MRKPTPSLAISVAALLVALGGTGYAAATLTGADIKNQTVTGKDVKNGSLKAKDLKEGVIPKIPTATRWLLVDRSGVIVRSRAASRSAPPTTSSTTAVRAVPARRAGQRLHRRQRAARRQRHRGLDRAAEHRSTRTTTGSSTVARRAPTPTPSSPARSPRPSAVLTGSSAARPTGANTDQHLRGQPAHERRLARPRRAPASPPTPNTHKRFYVIITGDSSDYVAPAA